MEINNYLSNFLTNYFGNLVPSISNIKLLSSIIKKYIPNPKLMYHLYSNQCYIDFVLLENGIQEIICIEPDFDFVRLSIETKKYIRSPNKDLLTIYNLDPLSNEINYSNADIIFISYQTDLTNILTKINNECKLNTLLIIESYNKPLIQLKYISTMTVTNNISIYIYKL
jgi:hypothetical protein